LSIIQGPFFCRAVPNPNITIRNLFIAVGDGGHPPRPPSVGAERRPAHAAAAAHQKQKHGGRVGTPPPAGCDARVHGGGGARPPQRRTGMPLIPPTTPDARSARAGCPSGIIATFYHLRHRSLSERASYSSRGRSRSSWRRRWRSSKSTRRWSHRYCCAWRATAHRLRPRRTPSCRSRTAQTSYEVGYQYVPKLL
jgi:hypothetical protein